MEIKCNNRRFKIWKYSVSHSTLLVRSPKDKEFNTNIDITFYGVELINLPYSFYGTCITSISQTNDMDLIEVIENLGYNTDEVVVFRGDKHKFYVIASGIQVEENEDDIFKTKF